jgi:hypothetical protein
VFSPPITFKLILNVITEQNECDLGHYIHKNVQLHREQKRDWSGYGMKKTCMAQLRRKPVLGNNLLLI